MANPKLDTELQIMDLESSSEALPLAFRTIYMKRLTEAMHRDREGFTNARYSSLSYETRASEIPLSKYSDK
jgi:hypothetical protein